MHRVLKCDELAADLADGNHRPPTEAINARVAFLTNKFTTSRDLTFQ